MYEASAQLIVQPMVQSMNQLEDGDDIADADAHVLRSDADLDCVRTEGQHWNTHFNTTAQRKQEMVQHHVHLPSTSDPNERVGLPSCKPRQGDTGDCKHGYPKLLQLAGDFFDATVVCCKGIATRMGLKISGGRNALGMVKGPRNDPWVDGTHPMLTSHLNCNSNVMISYRLPILPETHSRQCDKEDCLKHTTMIDVIQAMSRAMRDAVGYITDYVCKRQPYAQKEIKKWKVFPLIPIFKHVLIVSRSTQR